MDFANQEQLQQNRPPFYKLATPHIFPKVIAMTNAFAWLTPEWIRARQYHLLAPIVALVIVAFLDNFTFLIDRLEFLSVNLRFQTRAAHDPKADPRIVFVGIDEFSLSQLGKWIWPRYVEAKFLNEIATSDDVPNVVAFDVLFTEETDKKNPDKTAQSDDQMLGDAAGELPIVITGALSSKNPAQKEIANEAIKRTQEALANPGPTQAITTIIGNVSTIPGSDVAVLPVLPLRSQSLFGFVNDNPSPIDGIRHTLPLVVRVGDKVYASLSLQTLCQMLGVNMPDIVVDLPGKQIRIKDLTGKIWTIPTDQRAQYTINYRNEDSFQEVSFAALAQNIEHHMGPNKEPLDTKCDIRKKTIFIGGDATAIDVGPSPLAGQSPLPFAHLNLINNVLQHDYLTFVPWYFVVIGWLITTWITVIRLKVAPLTESVGMPCLVVFVYAALAFGIFAFWSIQIALAWPVLSYAGVTAGGIVLRWKEEQKKSQQLRSIFSQMVSPEIMKHILQNPENMNLGGQDRPTTILFSDIRGFTNFSEGKTAGEVMDQLNTYFERMVHCVTENKGTLHKFIGDAIMAAWGDIADASRGAEEDARNAVRSALVMRRKLRDLNDERSANGLVPIKIGVGLNHGIVQAGMLGSSGRKEFTVIGDEVNVASRLEGMTKEFKTDLAISESVRVLVGDEFLVRRVGLIVFKGKSTPTVVYEVLAEKGDIAHSKLSPEMVARYEEAFDHFLARRFGKAVDGFEACAKVYPDDYCVKTYLEASREYLASPPPEDWDGRIVMTTK